MFLVSYEDLFNDHLSIIDYNKGRTTPQGDKRHRKDCAGITLSGSRLQMDMKQMEGETGDCRMDYYPLDFNKKQ